jgi:ABC-2 type transport system permease protein
MARFWAVVRREYLERVRSKWFVIATVFGPLFFGILMFIPAWLSIRAARTVEAPTIAILDATGSALGGRVAGRLRGGLFGDTSSARLVSVPPAELAEAEAAALRAVMTNEVTGFLVLPPTALRDTVFRYAGRNAAMPMEMERLQRAVRDGILAYRLEQRGVSSDLVLGMMTAPVSLASEQVTERGRAGSGRIRFIFAAAIALVLYISILVHGQNIMRGVLEEKTTRVAEVVVASVSPHVLLAGKLVGIGAVGLTQVVAWIVGGFAMTRARAPIMRALGLPPVAFDLPAIGAGSLVLLVLYFLLGFVLFAALYAVVGAIVGGEQEAQQAVVPLMIVVFAPLMLLQPVLLNPTARLAEIGSWLPFTAPVIMPLRLSLVPVPAGEIAISVAVNAAACAAAVWVAGRVYRVGVLMYGKRATLGEVARWVRG